MKKGIKTRIFDKNGKQTTVIKKDSSYAKSTRIGNAADVKSALANSDSFYETFEIIKGITDRRILNRLARDKNNTTAVAAQSSGNLAGKDYNSLYDEKTIISYAALDSPSIVHMEANRLGAMIDKSGVADRRAAAANHHMPESILLKLKKDESGSVAAVAKKSLERHYRRNPRLRIRDEGILFISLDAAYDQHSSILVSADYQEKIERSLGNVENDDVFYHSEDNFANRGRNGSDRYQTIKELVSSSNFSGMTTIVDSDVFESEAKALTDDLFKAAGLGHEIPPSY